MIADQSRSLGSPFSLRSAVLFMLKGVMRRVSFSMETVMFRFMLVMMMVAIMVAGD